MTIGSSSLGRTYLENDLRTMQEWRIHERHEHEKRLEYMLWQNPCFSRKDAEVIMSINFPLAIDHFELKFGGEYLHSTVASAYDFFTDDSLQKRIRWRGFDQFPEEFRERLLDRLMKQYAYALSPDYTLTKDDLETIPDPVLVANYLMHIDKRVGELYPELSYKERRVVSDLSRAQLLSESYAVPHLNYNGDIGLFGISTSSRNRLSRFPAFKEYDDKDYYMPDVSIKAGTKILRDFYVASRGNMNLALTAYNTGIPAALEKKPWAIKYHDWIMSRYDWYINKGYSPTWDRISREVEANRAAQLDKPQAENRLGFELH